MTFLESASLFAVCLAALRDHRRVPPDGEGAGGTEEPQPEEEVKKKKKRSWLEEEGARRLAYESSLPLRAACLGLAWTCVGTNTGTLFHAQDACGAVGPIRDAAAPDQSQHSAVNHRLSFFIGALYSLPSRPCNCRCLTL